jgi:hypothetical protein
LGTNTKTETNTSRFDGRQPTSDEFNKTYEPFNKHLDKKSGIEDNRPSQSQTSQK